MGKNEIEQTKKKEQTKNEKKINGQIAREGTYNKERTIYTDSKERIKNNE